MTPKQLEGVLRDALEDMSLEEFFEAFDLTPLEVVETAYDAGLLDDEILESMIPSDS